MTAALQGLISNYQTVYDTAGQGLFKNGTTSAPGIAFDLDQDTGLFRPASNTLSLVAGAAEQLRLAAGEASGAAVQSNHQDDTVGKLMKNGAFGIGATKPGVLADLDDQTTPIGFYSVNALTGGTRPPDAAQYGMCILLRASDTAFGQVFLSNFGGGIYCRAASSGVWGSWEKIFSSTTVVGTVSTSPGSPTGALFEANSNANGSYIRFADGTQICWTEGVTFTYGAPTYLEFGWIYPAAFVATPNRFATLSHIAADYIGCAMTDFGHVACHNGDLAGATRAVRGPGAADFISGDHVLNCRVTAIGRYF
ncbi:pyocin knob domain-containing protein [Pseudophaeobacter sp.]|uniref:pyocin knob domain-containing protein n=1 Tax=Pseudophaeobacter sp. TaxID=1971739 RepID=UPI00260A26F0|nr:pyocin knob domain-containing protein [Pseudophaeobacter sp.]